MIHCWHALYSAPNTATRISVCSRENVWFIFKSHVCVCKSIRLSVEYKNTLVTKVKMMYLHIYLRFNFALEILTLNVWPLSSEIVVNRFAKTQEFGSKISRDKLDTNKNLIPTSAISESRSRRLIYLESGTEIIWGLLVTRLAIAVPSGSFARWLWLADSISSWMFLDERLAYERERRGIFLRSQNPSPPWGE